MPETQDLLRQLAERTQQRFEAQQPSPVMSALGQLSASLQTVAKQQEQAEQNALENAFKKAQTSKINAEIDLVKNKSKPLSESQKKFYAATFQSTAPDLPVPNIETQGDIDNLLDFMKNRDLHADRAAKLDLSERRFSVQQQQFTERMNLMNRSLDESRVFRAQVLGEKDPNIRALLSRIAELDDAIVANTSKAPQIREGLQLDASLATLQAERDKAMAELQGARDRGPSGKPSVRLPNEGKAPTGKAPNLSIEERKRRLREKYKKPGG